MNRQGTSIDLVKMGFYILKRIWLVVLCAAVGFGIMYFQSSKMPNMYTASGTMFVTSNNPNLVNYGYASTSDWSNAVRLVSIYSEVIKSEKVMQRVLEYRVAQAGENGAEQDLLLSQKYPGITTATVRGSISMASVNETPVVRVSCRTTNPEMSADICNAVLQVAPSALFDVIGAGDAKPQDFATVPTAPNARNDRNRGLTGAAFGAVAAAAILALLFIMNRRIQDTKELQDSYNLPILSSIRRNKEDDTDPGHFLLNEKSSMDLIEGYAKLRMNLLYTLVGKVQHAVLVTSAVSGEGKSTIASSLAVSLAMSGKKILLVDADMRRACQGDIFHYDSKTQGLSDILVGSTTLDKAILPSGRENLDLLPAGSTPPNPSELLESQQMKDLLAEMEGKYDLVLLDAPPVNIVSDPLALSGLAAGALFVVRQDFSLHPEVKRALGEAEMTGLNVLGFVFYGEKIHSGEYYSRKYYYRYRYKGYGYYRKYDPRNQYEKYDTRKKIAEEAGEEVKKS